MSITILTGTGLSGQRIEISKNGKLIDMTKGILKKIILPYKLSKEEAKEYREFVLFLHKFSKERDLKADANDKAPRIDEDQVDKIVESFKYLATIPFEDIQSHLKELEEEKIELETLHKKERDGRVRDRLKAVLLKDEGWTQRQIAQALRIYEETVHDHLEIWKKEKRLVSVHAGSSGKLTKTQTQQLVKHLKKHTYTTSKEICNYIKKSFGITYSLPGMTKWLHTNNFRYKKPKGVPAKADPVAQQAFIAYYNKLKKEVGKEEDIEKLDVITYLISLCDDADLPDVTFKGGKINKDGVIYSINLNLAN